MKIFTRTLIPVLLIITLLANFETTFAQPCNWSGWSGTNYPTIPCGSFSGNISVGSGTYTYFTAYAGASYTISTCGSSFDTQLSIYDANPAWTYRAGNDDNGTDCSGAAASLTWTATYTGDHIAIVNRFNCQQHDFTGASAVLKFRQNPPTITSSNATMCSGQQRTLSADQNGGSWSGTGVSGNVFTAPTTAGNYTVFYSIGNCTVSQVIPVNTNSTAPTSISGVTTFCAGGSTTLTANGGTHGSGASYQWFSDASGGCSGTVIGTGQSLVVTTAGTYYVRRTGSCNTTTCISTTVTVNSLSTAPSGVTVGTATICQGSSSTLTVQGGSLGTGATWNWYSSGCGTGFVQSGSSITVSPGSTTTYSVLATGTCNTTSCASGSVTVNPTPGATISGGTTVCQGASSPNITINNSTALPVTVSYTVNGSPTTANISASSSTTIAVPTGVAGTFTYTLTGIQYQSAPVCATTISGTQTVTVRPTPTATIGSDVTVCQNGSSPNITFTNPQSLPVTVTYKLNGGSNQTINVNGNSVANIAAPTGTAGTFVYSLVSVQYQTAPNCPNTISGSATVTVRPTITATIGVDVATVCQNGSQPIVTFTNPQALPITLTYNINGTVQTPVSVPASGSTTVLVSTGTAAVYTYNLVSAVYTTTPTCSSTLSGSVSVTVRPTPAATISGTTAVCQNATSPVITISNPNSLAETIGYTVNGNAASVTLNGNSSTTISVSTATVGPVVYALTSAVYTTSPTCVTSLVGTGSATVTVNPLPVLTEESHVNLSCLNSNDGVITFFQPNTTGPYQYSITGGSSFQSSRIFTGLAADTYNTFVVEDANGCRNATSPTITLTQPTQLNISLVSTTDASCNGVFDGGITVSGSGGTPSYQYSLSGGPYQPGASFTNLAAGNYTVTIKDAQNCTNTVNAVISNSYTVTATISNPVNVSCPGLQDGGYTITGTGGVTPYNYANNGLLFGTNNVFTGLTIGTYTGFVRDSRGCLASDQVTITANPAPNALITGTASFCAGGSTLLSGATSTPGSGNITGWQWKLNGSDIGGATGPTYSATAAGNYTLVVTNSNNCSTTSAVTTVTVNPLPTITVNPFTTAICAGGSIALTASGASTYTWSPSTGLSATTGTTVTASPTTTRTYTITGTDVNGCVNSTTKTVTVNSLPTVGVSPSAPTICNGGSVQLTASGANSYTWSPATGLLSTSGTTVTAQPTSTQTYTVTGTNLNNCSNTATATVTVTSLPAVTITPTPANATICVGQSITLTSNFANGNVWSNGATTQSITVSPTQSTSYSLSSTQSGCAGNATQAVTVNPVPFASINPQPSVAICTGSSTTLSAVTDNGISYLWSPGGATTQTATYSTAGAKTVTITNSYGCSSTSPATTVVVNSLPTVSVSPSAPTICNGNSVQLTASGASTYTWSPATGLLSTSGTTVTAQPTSTTTYTVTGTDLNGCQNTQTVQVSVTNLPTVTITSNPVNATICLGQSITLTSNFATGNLWSTGATTQSITVSPTQSTSYSLTSTQSSCPGTATKAVTVNPVPFAVISPSPAASICPGGSVTLSAATDIGTNYLWSPGGATTQTISASAAGPYTVTITNNATGCSATSTATTVSIYTPPTVNIVASPVSAEVCVGNSVSLTASGGVSYSWSNGLVGPTISVSASGTYTVTATDANGCTNTASKVVTINPLPTVSFSGLSSSYCDDNCTGYLLTGSPAGGTFTYTGSTGFSANTFTPCTAEGGTYTITYTYTNPATGCTNSSSQTTTVHPVPQPTVTALTPTTVCFGNTVILTTEAAAGYLWSNGATTQSISLTSVAATGSYNVTSTDAFGCSATSTPNVSVTINALPTPTISVVGNNPTTFCAGGSITLITANASSYSWLPGLETSQSINVSTSGNYQVNVIDGNGCQGTSAVTAVTVNPNPVPTISGSLTFCTGGSTTLTSSAAAFYDWSPNGETTQSITASATGTYTVDVEDANGCTGSASVTVNETPVTPVITALSNTTFCVGQSVTLYSSSTTGNLWTPSNETTQFITVTTGGTVTLDVSAGSCQGTDQITITVNSNPTVSFNGLDEFYCYDAATVTLSGSPSGGTFSGPGIFGDDFTPASAGIGSHAVTYTYVDGNGCSGSELQNVDVTTLPAVSFSGLATQYCENNPVAPLFGSPAGGTFTGTGISGNNFNPSVGPGTYTITYTYSDGNGCENSSSQTVTVHAAPVVSFTGLDSDYCADEPAVSLSGSPLGGSFSGNGIIGSQFFPSIPGAGTHTVTYTLSNSYGCSSSSSQQVTVHALPTVSFSGFNVPRAYCVDAAAVTLTGSPVGGTFTGNGISGTTFNPATAGVGTHTITYTYTDGFCTNTSTQNVTVNPLPSVTATPLGSTSVCNGASVTIYSSSGTGNLWSPNGETSQFIFASQSGPYSVTVTDGNGCVATSNTVNITVSPLPQPVITANGPLAFCQGGNVTLGLTIPYSNYLWSNGATTSSIVVSSSGNFSVTVTDGNGCSSTSAATTVTVNPLPTAGITPSGTVEICSGATTTLQGTGGVSYLWSTTETTQNIITGTAGTYTVTVTDGNGCTSVSAGTTVVVNSNPVPTINPLSSTTFCQGGSVTLVATAAASYLWSPNGETNQMISVTSSGSYSVSIVDANGCSGTSAPTVVTVNPTPQPVIVPNGPTTFCQGNSVTLELPVPYAQYLWSNGSTTSSIVVNSSGNYYVNIVDANGCTNMAAPVTVTVNPLPTAGISPSGTVGICAGSSITLQGSGGSSYVWSPNGETTQNITVSSAGTYFVTVTDGNSCVSVSPTTIVVVNNNPVPTITPLGATTFCQGGSVTLVASAGASYLWSPNGETNQIISVTASGNYTVTINDGNGCVGTSSVTAVTVNPLPVVNYTGLNSEYCVDAPSVLLTVTPSGGFFTGPVTGNTFNPALAGVGTHVITYQFTNGSGCTNSHSQTVIVHPLPVVSFSGLGGPHCVDAAAVTLTGSPTGGTFSGPGISGLQFNPATAGAGTHTITYTYTDGNGCVNSQSQTVVVNPLPVVNFTGLDAEYCIDEAAATLVPSPPGGAFSGTGMSGSVFDPAIAGAGTYTITYTYTNGNGCTNSTSQTVTVHALPVVTFNTLANQYCITETSVALSGSPVGGTFTGVGVTANIFNPSTAGVGSHTLTYTYTDANGCTNFATQTAVVVPLPVVSFTGLDAAYCVNASAVALTGTPTGGTFSGVGVSGNNFVPSQAGVGTHTVIYTYTDQFGCTSSSSQSVVVNPLPVISFSGLGQDYCINETPATLIGSPQSGTFSGPGISGNIFSPANAGAGTHTVTFTYNDINGCTGVLTQNVIVYDLPVVSITPITDDFCVTETTVALSATPSGGIFSGSGVSGNNFNPSAAGVGTHTITYYYTDVNGCTNSDNIDITVLALPVVTFSGLSTQYCADAVAVTLVGNPTGGTFSGNGITGNSFNPAAAGLGITTITYTYTDGSGCTNSTSQNTSVTPLPVVSISGLAPQYCVSASPVSLTGNPSGGSFSGPGMAGGIFSPSVAGAGVHAITYSYTDGSGCTGTTSVNVTVNALPVVTITNTTLQYCISEPSVLLTATPTGGVFSGNGVSGNFFNAATAGVGTHQITYQYADNNGCSNTAVISFEVVPLPIVSFAGLALQYCEDASAVTLTGSPSGGVFAGSGITDNVFDPAGANIGPTDITYTYTDNNGCSNTATQTTNVYSLPIVQFSGLYTEYCVDAVDVVLTPLPAGGAFIGPGMVNNTTFSPSSAGVGTHTLTYAFQNNVGCIGTVQQTTEVHALPVVSFTGLASIYCLEADSVPLTGTPVGGSFTGPALNDSVFYPFYAGAAQHTINYTYYDNNGCGSTYSQTTNVYQLAQPQVTANGPVAFCQGDDVTLTAQPPFMSYLWSNGSTTQSVLANTESEVSVTIQDVNGCRATSDTIQITVYPLPVVNLGPDVSVCPGTSVTFDAGAGFADYVWVPGGTTNQTLTVVANSSTAGDYRASVTDVNGCFNYDEVTLVVYTPQVPVVTANGSPSICEGQSVVLNAGSGFQSYLWNNTVTTALNTVTQSGSYSVTTTDGNGCSATSAPFNVTVMPLPIVTVFANGPTAICQGSTLTLTMPSGYVSYQWSNGATTSSIFVNQAGDYFGSATNSAGCSNVTSTITVTVNPQPQPVITPQGPVTLCFGETIVLDAGNQGYTTYNWYRNLNPLTVHSQYNTVGTNGSYTVEVIDVNGCGAGITSPPVIVTVLPQLVPLISISPDQDTLYSTPAQTYQWYYNGVAVNGANQQSFVPQASGNYSVTVTDNNDCEGTSAIMEFSYSGIGMDENAFSSINLFPNPGKGRFTVVAEFGSVTSATIQVSDMLGNRVMPAITVNDANALKQEISVEQFANGVYFVSIITEKGQKVIRYIKE